MEVGGAMVLTHPSLSSPVSAHGLIWSVDIHS